MLEYEARVLVAARSYIALDVDPGSSEWSIVSFRAVGDDEAAELAEAETASSVTLGGSRYRVEFGKRGEQKPDPQDHRKVHVTLTETATIFAGAESRLLVRRGDGAWQSVQTA